MARASVVSGLRAGTSQRMPIGESQFKVPQSFPPLSRYSTAGTANVDAIIDRALSAVEQFLSFPAELRLHRALPPTGGSAKRLSATDARIGHAGDVMTLSGRRGGEAMKS